MKTTEINIRDPYILVHGGKYYLYGTRSATCCQRNDSISYQNTSRLADLFKIYVRILN